MQETQVSIGEQSGGKKGKGKKANPPNSGKVELINIGQTML